ncbi:2'-5' RNA ligase family protein [Rhodococcus sp. BP-349]|uniref:2'-5' RNA ligase family protein n=1 Tax=unclassified Rhodococcus (in: high G+C Gram-positive bacteria) TaxID=192944 RepID=UPI001C9A97F6|nr:MULTISPECIES: 2'-5' RNA ligase family protein [unclassified Rhodococcus (in: high G+C Gram-positive bacteria)]MBY6539051.1 2'-5' RNA ligase family protein [Rhodococcus sp. BP-363]MBY6543388.1 2'-5' RNA ligase family protein [Rhodococcus sp. BP-369]MBY6562618.1 2'-5' RNA ligase family protein [Rhodococcus sp. BP-370]MBY6576910.1 2'-5' RNA ligase family protein [Rhodococcus sp. BP-364]MBY6586211.1 2'-5' RNA ligase family protein [Rhodococcus sp. BP-358]
MVQSVELLLDERSDDAIRREWNYLAELGLPSQARHAGASNRPHVTIAVASRIDDVAEHRLAALIADGRDAGSWRFPESVRLGGLVVFGGSRAVLARSVVPTAALLDLHARVHEVLADSPGIPPHLHPGHWTPHVTLAMRARPEDIGSAASHLVTDLHDVDAEVSAVRRWDGDARADWLIG